MHSPSHYPPSHRHLHLHLLIATLFLTTVRTAQAVRTTKLLEKWARRRDYPLAVLESGGGVLQDASRKRHLIVAGGYIANSRLKTTSATYALPLQSSGPWRRLANMPLDLTHVGQAIVRDRMYTAGGFAGQAPGRTVSDCFMFHLPSNKWSRLPNLPAPRAGGGLVYISQLKALLFTSGIFRATNSHSGQDKDDTWILYLGDLGKGWQSRAKIFNPRNHMAAIAVGGRYFFLGGQHRNKESTDNQDTMQEYDFRRDRWIGRRKLPMPVGHIAASTMSFSRGILYLGGITNGRMLSNRIYYYDIFSDQWTYVGTYARKVQSPVCGIASRRMFCATGAGTGSANLVYTNRLAKPKSV